MKVRLSLPIISLVRNEILVAHKSNKKISYHVIIKACTKEGNEILVKNFLACGVITKVVNKILDSKILVLYRPNNSDLVHDKRSTFIGLEIYNKDCALTAL